MSDIETKTIIVIPEITKCITMEDVIAQCSGFRGWMPISFIFEGNDRKELKIVLEIKKRRREND
jgi:hypothetical protein